MKNSKDLDKVVPYVAIVAALGAAAYSFIKTYKAVSRLGEDNLDFGNDPVLSSMFNRKDTE